MRYIIIFFIFLNSCSNSENTSYKSKINRVLEFDDTIGFEIESDSFLIHEMYQPPIKSNKSLETRVDSLFALRKNNRLKEKSYYSKFENTKSFIEEYYLEKPNWKKILTFDPINNNVENIKIEIDNKDYFNLTYNPDKTIKNEVSKYIIEIKRITIDSSCIIIEQPGYEHLDYEYEFYVSFEDSRIHEKSINNIIIDKRKAYGQLCKEHPANQDSLYIKCKLSKIISRKKVGENIEILQTNTEFEFAKKIPEIGHMIILKDKG